MMPDTFDGRPGTGNNEGDLDTEGDIHEVLKKLRLEEVHALSYSSTNIRSANAAEHYFYRIYLETARYILYVFWTWWGLAMTTLFGGLGPFDCLAMFFYAFGGTIVLFFALVVCLIVNSPILTNMYWEWSSRHGGGLGLVNNANPKMFEALTPLQVKAAKEFLSETFKPEEDTATKRRFNLDAAKLLLQFSAIVYEHPNEAVRNAVRAVAGSQDKGLNADKRKKVTEALSEYDREGNRGDFVIRKFCHRIGVEFEPLSELGNTSSAFAALFWDPKDNWIAVTFKGTQPIEFGEWLSDLNAKMSHVGSHIPGFRKVHLGFKERVFPEDLAESGLTRPYDTISKGVRLLAEWLHENNGCRGKRNINIWVTGHSLGCATATLVYSRFLMREKEIGPQSDLRDAYLFAAPIVSDRESVEVFNAKMMEDPAKPRTMWRVTSNGDFVATCLPELGDYNSIAVSSNNGFAFAHFGTELKLRFGRSYFKATGNHLTPGTVIKIESEFKQWQINSQREKYEKKGGLKEIFRLVTGFLYQNIPLVGRFVAHATVFYWDQLEFLDPDEEAVWAWN